jgi:hypothetical protein
MVCGCGDKYQVGWRQFEKEKTIWRNRAIVIVNI